MNRMDPLNHKFVHYIPEDLVEGVLYVSIPFVTAMHLCCCGCGNEVVTPLNPDGWHMTFDGESVSLFPSIGSWSLPCQSHYWIQRNQVWWARHFPKYETKAGQILDRFMTVLRASRAWVPLRRFFAKWIHRND